MEVWHKAAPAGLAPNLSLILQLLLHLHTQWPLLNPCLALEKIRKGYVFQRSYRKPPEAAAWSSLALLMQNIGSIVAKLSLLPCTALLLQHTVQQTLHTIRGGHFRLHD